MAGFAPAFIDFDQAVFESNRRDTLFAGRRRGVALQAGFDVDLNDKGLGLTFDAKRYFVDTTAQWYVGDTLAIQTNARDQHLHAYIQIAPLHGRLNRVLCHR